MYSTFKWKQVGELVLTTFAYVIPYQQLSAMARPAYGDDGELIDGGFDMSTGGICGYEFFIIIFIIFGFFSNLFLHLLN